MLTGYLQVGALVRERRTEEGGDDAHHCVRHVVLQLNVCVFAICRRVTHLDKPSDSACYNMPSDCPSRS